jgi:hypothetical protein
MTKLSNYCSTSDITKLYVVEAIKDGYIANLTADTITTIDISISGDFYNCGTGSTSYFNVISACTDNINVGSNLIPTNDNTINIGSSLKRFREINTVSGTSTVWVSTIRIETPEVNLGYDSDNELRILDADNSVIQDDILNGGIY